MSIIIDENKCIGCGRCESICPGNLINMTELKKAYMKYPKDCWGCTSCMKECSVCAISFYLGADLGGRASKMTVQKKGDLSYWTVQKANADRNKNNNVVQIVINTKASNQY